MTLRSLTALILIPAFAATFLVVWFFFDNQYIANFRHIEARHIDKQSRTIMSISESYTSQLLKTAYDWATWDDSYRFMQDKNPQYIQSNLVSNTLYTLGVDALIYLNKDLNYFYSLEKEELTASARTLAQEIKNAEVSLYDVNVKPHWFFMNNPDDSKIDLAVCSPVTDSRSLHAPDGLFCILNGITEFIETAYSQSGYSVSSLKMIDTADRGDNLSTSVALFKDHADIRLFSPVRGLEKDLELTFRIERDYFKFISSMTYKAVFVVMLIFFAAAGSVTFLMNRFVLRRIKILTLEFKRMEESAEFEKRLPEKGIAELKLLAATANRTLDDIRHLNKKLLMMSNVDGLTCIPNRRSFDAAFDSEFRRAQRSGSTLSILMLDIDNFKCFNDTYGHLNGDECLKACAKIIASSLQRPADLAARFGGEEFAVILPDTDSLGAAHIAETIRQSLENSQIKLSSGEVVSVTVSIGFCSLTPAAADTKNSLLEKADKALYQAKKEKNRSVCFQQWS